MRQSRQWLAVGAVCLIGVAGGVIGAWPSAATGPTDEPWVTVNPPSESSTNPAAGAVTTTPARDAQDGAGETTATPQAPADPGVEAPGQPAVGPAVDAGAADPSGAGANPGSDGGAPVAVGSGAGAGPAGAAGAADSGAGAGTHGTGTGHAGHGTPVEAAEPRHGSGHG